MIKKPKKKGKKKAKTMKELTKGYEKFIKSHEHNGATKEDFDTVLKKIITKPSSK
ncbi:MAG TPA: hypothetical protein VK783_13675 [Bacteroidia bacterium]|jgi:hypothetical protein|nr:hypothetical protein [Bacteroidia bacterium]